jgi:predicted glycosyl hydrolase (DUF1957 family)
LNKSVFVILHWNSDYAEIPRKELPQVVEKSYKPMLSAMEDFDGTICCNISGHTIEYLLKNNPDIIDTIQNLIKKKKIELLGTGYSHPILPLLHHPLRLRQQIFDHLDLTKKTFGCDLRGFWPPELAISPLALQYIKNAGYNWVVVDEEHLLQAQTLTNDANPFEKRKRSSTEILIDAYFSKNPLSMLRNYIKALRYLTKQNKSLKNSLVTIQYSSSQNINSVLSSQSWWNSTRFAISKTTFLYTESKHLKLIRRSSNPYIPLYTSDIEFFGYREFGGKIPQPSLLINFLKRLRKFDIRTISPSSISMNEWKKPPVFAGTGSWSENKSFSIWTDSEDNRELSRELHAIYVILSQKNWDKDLMVKIEPLLRIAENSDARGWGPIAERKLEAFTAIQEIYKELGM